MDECILEIRNRHFAAPPASSRAIRRFSETNGFTLPDEFQRLYTCCNGARLFKATDAPYTLVPVQELVRVRQAIYGTDDDQYGPADWYAFCDVRDTDYVGVELNSGSDNYGLIRDCSHHNPPQDWRTIAKSLREFLGVALNSEGRLYWLGT